MHMVLRAAPGAAMAWAGAAPTFGNRCTELKSHSSSIYCPFDEQISHVLNLLSLTWLTLESPGPRYPEAFPRARVLEM